MAGLLASDYIGGQPMVREGSRAGFFRVCDLGCIGRMPWPASWPVATVASSLLCATLYPNPNL